jgi:hypothetical protein
MGPMTGTGRLTWIACGLAASALYFSLALWLKQSYVEPPRPTGERVIRLVRPFFELLGSNNRVFSVKRPELEDLSDTMDQPTRSPFVLYEGTRPLGPPHSDHVEIMKYGHGRFSHWNQSGFVFTSSDGTNPRYNGRTYWAVIPPPAGE